MIPWKFYHENFFSKEKSPNIENFNRRNKGMCRGTYYLLPFFQLSCNYANITMHACAWLADYLNHVQ